MCVLYVAMGVAVSFAAIVAGVVVYAVYVRADLKKSACPVDARLAPVKCSKVLLFETECNSVSLLTIS